ncbi:hypothetical protein [Vibrio sp. STUT-A11]|uniref:hypothetical protein n=1 Tax=unclassified Vibrio TaxID=2614977 RepID=UPI00222EC512|nr:hypothetical protein [Vibrio sp. STUT-A11]
MMHHEHFHEKAKIEIRHFLARFAEDRATAYRHIPLTINLTVSLTVTLLSRHTTLA